MGRSRGSHRGCHGGSPENWGGPLYVHRHPGGRGQSPDVRDKHTLINKIRMPWHARSPFSTSYGNTDAILERQREEKILKT